MPRGRLLCRFYLIFVELSLQSGGLIARLRVCTHVLAATSGCSQKKQNCTFAGICVFSLTFSSLRTFWNLSFVPTVKKVCDSGYDWDVTDWKPNNFGVVPQSVASVACGRRAYSDIPSSPESRRSVSSAATGRSRRSHRSDALSGHYCSSEKQRRTKQLMQMVDKNNVSFVVGQSPYLFEKSCFFKHYYHKFSKKAASTNTAVFRKWSTLFKQQRCYL